MSGLLGDHFLARCAIGALLVLPCAAYAAPVEVAPRAADPSQPAPIPDDTLAGKNAAVAAQLTELLAGNSLRFSGQQERSAVEAFYRNRRFAPLWTDNGQPTARAQAAVAFLRTVGIDGLAPEDYPTPQFASSDDAAAIANDELLLTRSILSFARHARTGRIHFTRVTGAAFYDLQVPDAAKVLAEMAGSADIRTALDGYHPQHPGYRALKAQLAEARKSNTDTTAVRVPEGPILRPGADDMRVPILRRRLKLPNDDSWRYDDALVKAVKAFQKGAGLSPDGAVGAHTLARLNDQGAAPSRTIDTIVANMERWRWLPRDLGPSHVVVNIPDYTLEVMDRGNRRWSTRIVVGKPGKMATPLISASMKYISINPTWNVPPSIIRNEYLPVLRSDPGALARTGLKIGRNRDGSIRIYQPPGERNALGHIRFNFPNKFLVYQHDTPDKHLFAKEARAFSHGCMRVQNPDKYAEVLLSIAQPNQAFSAERIRRMYGKVERTIPFPQPIPVHITYQTAFVDASGQLQIRKDIYGHDAEIIDLLHGSERRVADVPVKRNYTSNQKPVMARVGGDPPRGYLSRRGVGPYDPDDAYGYDVGAAAPAYRRRGFWPFSFR